MELEIIVAAIVLIAMVFLATVDMAFSHLSDVGLRRISSDEEFAEKRSVAFLRDILENRQRFRFALSSTIQILLIAFTVLLTDIILRVYADRNIAILLSLVVGIGATVILRQILPRILVRKNPERKLIFLLPAIRPIYTIATFFLEPISKRTKARQRLEATETPETAEERADRAEDNAEDFHALMEVGEAEGIIEESERELIETMVEFSDTRAGEIMTPRTEIVAISIEASIKAARDLIVERKYSRIPVYRDTIDNIEGVIYVRDLLQAWAEGKHDESVSHLIRDAFFVPETKTAAELLKTMQNNHVQIAVVIDEYGGVAGLITVEDILEEIVGEIEDEDEDEEIIEIIQGADGYWDVLGSTEIDKIERLLDADLEDEDYTTIAGLVTTEAGYVPKTGESLILRGLQIEILNADEKRVNLVRIRQAEPEPDAEAE
jgi:putative hemolysin